MSDLERIVCEANRLFRASEYVEARKLYERAAMRYGHELFEANRILCEQAINGDEPIQTKGMPEHPRDLQEQLDETQKLLEHYFQRCETLEHQNNRS